MLRKAEGGCRFILRDGHRLNSASEGFRHVASAKESEPCGGAGFTGNMDACLRKAEVEEKKSGPGEAYSLTVPHTPWKGEEEKGFSCIGSH